jgi:quercetin dioxygenase-like cupin family protein
LVNLNDRHTIVIGHASAATRDERVNPMQKVLRTERYLAAATFVTLFLSAAVATEADKSAVGLDAKPILKANQTVIGGPLKYPGTGKPEITSLIVTIQPGGHTNLHQHPVVTFVYVLEGEAELRVGDKSFHYKAGDSWVEPIDTPNQLFNAGTVPVKNLVVFVGSEGMPNSMAMQ